MPQVLPIETDTLMPPFGVAEALVDETWLGHTDIFRFWLQTHAEPRGPLFWRTAILRECLPDPEIGLQFAADGPLMRQAPRTALVRVAVGELQ